MKTIYTVLGDGPPCIKPSETGAIKPIKLLVDSMGGSIMPTANYLAAWVSILAVLVTLLLGARVGYLRGRLKIDAPATIGHPQFERAFRTHANTVENLLLFLPLLWLASISYGGQIPFWLGLVWVISRIIYAFGYAQTNTQMRGPGAGIGFLALLGLLVVAIIGLIR